MNKLLEHDASYWGRGETIIAWDEAGFGSLCGSMFVACVHFPINFAVPKTLEKVNDSKKLSESLRMSLATEIKKHAQYHIIKIDIDQINTGSPYWLRFSEAKQYIDAGNFSSSAVVIFDGDRSIADISIRSESLIKGDSKSFSIASASILAKAAKDEEMIYLDKIYPQYSFASNKGYGTAEHIGAIKKYGTSPVHRTGYCSKLVN
jgi:ribonuclease HII